MGYQPPSGNRPYGYGSGYSQGFSQFPVSPSGSTFRGGGDDRPFKGVGKWNINLVDPYQNSHLNSGIPELGGDMPDLFDGVPVLNEIDNYYGQPGGLFAGLFGAIGQTVGGIFGQAAAGASIGGTIGKTLEAPAVAVLNAPTPLGALSEEDRQGIKNAMPKLFAEYGAPAKMSDLFGSFLGVFGMMGRVVERSVAGFADQGDGALFGVLGRDMPEQYEALVASGEMTRDEALDQMVIDNAGFSDDPFLNMLTSIVLDPMNLLSGGTGLAIKSLEATAKVGAGARIAARAAGGTEDIARAAQLAATSSRGGMAAAIRRIGVNQPGGVAGVLDGTADADRVGVRLSRLERLGLATFGPLTTESNSTIAKVADYTNNFASMGMNHLFGRSALGQQFNLDHLYTVAADGMVAGLGYGVVDDIVKMGDLIQPGGSDIFQKALAVGNGNIVTRYVVDEIVGNALRQGKVPKFEIAGQRVTATRMAQEEMVAKGLDPRRINEVVKTSVERNKPILLASKTMQEVADDTILKYADILNADPARVREVMGDVTLKQAEAIHAGFYYEKGRRLHGEIIPLLKNIPAASRVPGFKNPERLTMVAERTLTNIRLTPIEDALKAKQADALRELLPKYESFDMLDPEKLNDADLLETVEEWIAANRDIVLTEIPMVDANGVLRADLPNEIRDWANLAETQGYRLAEGVPSDAGDEALYRITRGKDGRIKNWNAWVDFVHDGPGSVNMPTRFERHLKQVFGTYRNERIYWRNRRAFITHLSSDITREAGDVRVPEGIATRLWDQVMRKSSEQGVTPRGLSMENIGDVVSNVMRAERARLGMAGQSLSDRQVMDATLKAFRGDFALVGATQAFTGAIKTTSSTQNYWGRLSEKLFPLMRFTLNPFFLGMEWTETYILNAMRGIATPLRKGTAGFASAFSMHRATEQMLRSTLTKPDGSVMMQAEALETYRRQAIAAKQFLGSQSRVGKLFNSIPGIRRVNVGGIWGDTYARKEVGRALLMQKVFGETVPTALRRVMGEENFAKFWRDQEDLFGVTDPGEVAMSWVQHNLAMTDANGTIIQRFHQIMQPYNFGRKNRIVRVPDPNDSSAMTHQNVAELLDKSNSIGNVIAGGYATRTARAAELTRTTGEAWDAGRVLIDDIASGRLTRDMLTAELVASRAAPADPTDLAELGTTIYNMAVGPTFEEFSRSMRNFAKGIRGGTGVQTRALRDEYVEAIERIITQRARSMGITPDEFVGRRMGDVVQVMNDVTNAPPNVVRLLEQRTGILDDIVGPSGRATRIRTAFSPSIVRVELENASEDYAYKGLSQFQLRAIEQSIAENNEGFIDQYLWFAPKEMIETVRVASQHLEPMPEAMARIDLIHMDDLGGGEFYSTQNFTAYDIEVMTSTGEWKSVRKIQNERGATDFPEVPPSPVPQERINLSASGRAVHEVDPEAITRSPAAVHHLDRETVITKEGLVASKFYEGNGYAEINCFLRGIEPAHGWTMSDAEIMEKIELLTEAAYKGMVLEPTPLWRGMNIDRVEQEFGGNLNIAAQRSGRELGEVSYLDLQAGDTFSDPAFMSFSESQSTAADFAKSTYHGLRQKTQPSVMLWWDAPKGAHANMVGGNESERVIPGAVEWEIVERIESEWAANYGGEVQAFTGLTEDFANEGDAVLILKVRQKPGRGYKPGVKNITSEEATLAEAMNTEVINQAVANPQVLHDRALTPEEVTEAQLLDDQAFSASQRNSVDFSFGDDRVGYIHPRVGLNDETRLLTEDEIEAAAASAADFRSRLLTMYSESGKNMIAATARAADIYDDPAAGLADIIDDIARLLSNTGDVRSVGDATRRALAKGVIPTRSSPMTTRASDLMDYINGNTSRRADGRLTGLQPIWADELAYRGAGYVSQKDIDELTALYGKEATAHLIPDEVDEVTGGIIQSDYRHERVVNYYNQKATLANRETWHGRDDWTAGEMAAISSLLEAKRTGRKGLALSGDTVRSNEAVVSLVTKANAPSSDLKYAELMSIFMEPQHAAARFGLSNHIAHRLAASFRDLGVAVEARPDLLYQVTGKVTDQSLVPLLIGAPPEHQDLLAEAALVIGRHEEARTWRLVEDTAGQPMSDFVPSIVIRLPQEATMVGATEATRGHALFASRDFTNKLAERLGLTRPGEADPSMARMYPKATGLTTTAERGTTVEEATQMADNAELAPVEDIIKYVDPDRDDLKYGLDEMTNDYLDELQLNIVANGIQRPVVVTQWSSGSWEVLDGSHRLVVAQAAGVRDIPVVYFDMGTQTYSSMSEAVDPMAASNAASMADSIIEGTMIAEDANGDYLLRIIDHDKVMPRGTDGALDEAWLTDQVTATVGEMKAQPLLDQGWDVTYDVQYGHGGSFKPPLREDGIPAWKEYERDLSARLEAAGIGGLGGEGLRNLRAETWKDTQQQIKRYARKQTKRAERGEPLIPHVLEEERGGTVYGATVVGEHDAVIEAFRNGDAVTGLHELVHVLARDLDPSMKRVVMEARANTLAARRTTVAAEAAALRARAQTATTTSVASRFNNRAHRLEMGLADLVDEQDWGVLHEEFFVSQMLRWFRTGTVDTGNADPTDFVHAVNYMRNHIEGVWTEVKGTRDPSLHASPEMQRLLNRMFNGTPPLEAVNYNVTDTAIQLAMRQQLGAAFDEAFQTHVFKKDRHFLERSLNHPYFGMYPASYMWGKILPEMVAFLALRPFGLTAPMLGWNVIREVSDSIKSEAELNPEYNKFLEDNASLFQLASMLFPALPHDIPANAPLPFRRIAEQGLENQVAYANGATDVTPVDYTKGASDALFYALGPAGSLRSTAGLPGQIGEMLSGVFGEGEGQEGVGPPINLQGMPTQPAP